MHLLYPFAKRFIAGEDLETALVNIKALYEAGFLSTIDVLGENVQNVQQVEAAKREYLELIHTLESLHFPMDLSVKLTQMGLKLDYDLCRRNVDELLRAVGQNTIRFDMEGSDCTEQILTMGFDLHRTHPNLGLVVQAYLHRTEKDVDTIIERGISTRLCKGAYKEPPSIAYQTREEIRENFLKLGYRLLKEGRLPAIATHDEYLIKKLIAFIQREKIAVESFYFELLYGVRRDLQKALLDKGYQVRIYVPYGKAWLPYTLRRLAERKENVLFVVKSLFQEMFGLGKLK